LSAVERGINLIDTAPIYGHGRSEEIVGKAMRAHGRREAFYIATKVGLDWNDRGVFANLTAARLRQEIEDSLRRLARSISTSTRSTGRIRSFPWPKQPLSWLNSSARERCARWGEQL